MAKSQVEKPESSGNRPIHELRRHALRAAIWQHQSERGTMFNVTVSRSYRDEAGQWHDSQSFGYDDLMNLAKVLADAHTWISSVRDREREAGPAQDSGRRG